MALSLEYARGAEQRSLWGKARGALWRRLNREAEDVLEGVPVGLLCAAVAVHNRWIIVMGGYDGDVHLSTLDVIDTTNHDVTVVAGPEMQLPRSFFGAAAVDNQIWVVGGEDEICLVESIALVESTDTSLSSSLDSPFTPQAHWTIHNAMQLSIRRSYHAVCGVPGTSCLAVACGDDGDGDGNRLKSVEVLDVHRCVVWRFPDLTVSRFAFSMLGGCSSGASCACWPGQQYSTIGFHGSIALCCVITDGHEVYASAVRCVLPIRRDFPGSPSYSVQ